MVLKFGIFVLVSYVSIVAQNKAWKNQRLQSFYITVYTIDYQCISTVLSSYQLFNSLHLLIIRHNNISFSQKTPKEDPHGHTTNWKMISRMSVIACISSNLILIPIHPLWLLGFVLYCKFIKWNEMTVSFCALKICNHGGYHSYCIDDIMAETEVLIPY